MTDRCDIADAVRSCEGTWVEADDILGFREYAGRLASGARGRFSSPVTCGIGIDTFPLNGPLPNGDRALDSAGLEGGSRGICDVVGELEEPYAWDWD